MAKSIQETFIPDGVDHWPECTLCPKLCDMTSNVCMEGDGPSTADILVIGPNPRDTDDELNRPLVSRFGEFFRDVILVHAKIPETKVRFTHAVRCRTAKNKTPTVREILRCRRYLEAEIKRVKPKVIVGLGDAPLATMLQFFYKGRAEEGSSKKKETKVSGIGRWQGKMVWLQEFQCWFMPTFSPDTFLRGYDFGSTYTVELVIDDLVAAWKKANEPRPSFEVPKSIVVTRHDEAALAMSEMYDAGSFAFDIETGGSGRSCDKRVIGCSFSSSDHKGYYIPWRLLTSRKSLYRQFVKLVTSRDHFKIMHNGAYEVRILRMAHDIDINKVKYFDTMIASSLVDENFSKRLKDLAWTLTEFGGYDVPLEKYKYENGIEEDYSIIPDELLFPYAAFDAVATWILYRKFQESLKRSNLIGLFEKVAMPVRRVMSDAEINGMRVDVDRAHALSDMCTDAIGRLEQRVYSEAGKEFNIGSPKQLQQVLYSDMGFTPLKETKTGYSADASSLEYIATQPGSAIVQFLLGRSYINTMLSTHIGQAIEFAWPEDGRVHTNYNTTGTVTGRTSCIAGGEPVVTRNGDVPIECVRVGDEVLSHTGVFRKVTGVLDQGIRPVYQLTTETCRSILCTSDHLFFTPQGWVRADELEGVYCVGIKDQDGRSRVSSKGGGVIRGRSTEAYRRRGGRNVGDYTSKRSSGVETANAFGEVPCRGGVAVLAEQDGGKEPDERQVGEGSPPVERCSLGRKGSFSTEGRWEAVSVSSCGVCAKYGNVPGESPKEHGSSSRRWRSLQQRDRQSRALYSGRTHGFAPKVESVTTFTYVGKIRVFDLVVDVDESFVVGGFLAHNCSRPSLQNVPQDRLIRSLYIASEGNLIVEADLKSAEMATIAAVSGEETFLRAFSDGLDIHSETFREIFEKPADYECTKLERRLAKTINFGLIYGLTSIGLARSLGLTVEEAAEYMTLYFERLPKVASWMEKQKSLVRSRGYVVSVFGRVRRLPLGLSDNWGDLSRAERQAMNSPIQSGAADYTYIGLIRLRHSILREGLQGKIVHTVHDCVLTDTPESEVEGMQGLIRVAFETPVKVLPVKMRVDVEINKRWGQENESKLEDILNSVGLKIT